MIKLMRGRVILVDSKKIIIFGPPGSGKGTQALKICKYYNLEHIAPGDILRAHIKNKTEIGLKAKEFVDKGVLVPEEIIFDIIREKISEAKQKGFVLDGFPRSIEQANELKNMSAIDLVINLAVKDEIIVDRISKRLVCVCGETYHPTTKPPKQGGICDKCGGKLYHRDDDNLETVKHRLDVYNKETLPLLDYYKAFKVIDIDGEKSVNNVFEEIKTQIDLFYN